MAEANKRLEDYPHPSLAADIVLLTIASKKVSNYRKNPEKHLEILLVRRGFEPYKGSWALPGGFINEGETIGQTARRELAEETGAEAFYLEQLHTFSKVGRDPRGWVVSCAYLALAPRDKLRIQAGDDAAEAAWFRIEHNTKPEKTMSLVLARSDASPSSNEETLRAQVKTGQPDEPEILSNSGLAFDHAAVIAYALERLQSKLTHTDVALSLLPERFTLTELQQTYELISGKATATASFRRKMAELLRSTDEFSPPAGHRTSRLYQRRDL